MQLFHLSFIFEVSNFVTKAQLAQHNISKKWQTVKFQSLLNRAYKTEIKPTYLGGEHEKATPTEVQDNWGKNLFQRSLVKPERYALVKSLNFAISPRQLPIVDLITAAESAIKNNKLNSSEAEQIKLKVSANLFNAKIPPSDIHIGERKTIPALSKDPNITILPADK